MTEPQPSKCLMGAPGGKLDDDKEYPKGAFCVERDDEPSVAEKPIESEPSGGDQFGHVAEPPAPARPNCHTPIKAPEDSRPVAERLADAQPGDKLSVVEPVSEKCLFGAPGSMLDDDAIHADDSFCTSGAHTDPENDDDFHDEDADEDYGDYGDPAPDGSVDDDVNAPESSVAADLEPSEDGLDPDETENPDGDIVRVNDDDVGPDGEIGPSFTEPLTPPEVVDDSVELDRSVPTTPLPEQPETEEREDAGDAARRSIEAIMDQTEMRVEPAPESSEDTPATGTPAVTDADSEPTIPDDYDDGDEQQQR